MTELDTLDSWILHSLRETLEYRTVRNRILRENLKREFKDNKQVAFGESIINEGDENEYRKAISQIALNIKKSKKYYYLFTVSNMYDPVSNETHFQSFIYEKPTNRLNIIEPSLGYYNTQATEVTVEIFKKFFNFEKKNIVNRRNKCQFGSSDVFCQSWSLYIQYLKIVKILKNDNTDIVIAKNRRFNLLLDFYKSNIDFYCKELKKSFNGINADVDKHLDDKYEIEATKRILRENKNIICDRIRNWTVQNLE